jgi:hypothetical protein
MQLPSANRGNAWRNAPGPQPQSWETILKPHSMPTESPDELADDILHGADEIAKFIYGERGSRRKVYYLAECTRLPVFRLGSMLCARRSVLLGWISGQERRVPPSCGLGPKKPSDRSDEEKG